LFVLFEIFIFQTTTSLNFHFNLVLDEEDWDDFDEEEKKVDDNEEEDSFGDEEEGEVTLYQFCCVLLSRVYFDSNLV
jgi:hypothetical protein